MMISLETRGTVWELRSGLRGILGVGLLLAAGSLSMHAQVSVTTWRNDNARTGQNLNETILNLSDVNSTQFGKLFSHSVDGYVYAQPLYLQNVTIGGVSHNVVFVATEHDSVYAFDADSNGGANANPLWFASMLTSAHGAASGATTVSSNDVGTDITPEVGITGTPVIDPSSGTLYVVSATTEGSTFVQRLHALDITSGAEKFGGPVVITATVVGTGNGSSGGTLTFDSEWENQRPGLLLLDGIVYIGFAAHGDAGPWHGWILGYNAQTLKRTGVFCASPNGVGSGIWMGGAGLAAEVVDPVNHPYGRMFVATGNGDYTATKPYAAGMDYGDSVLNLDLTNGAPTIQDEFTPSIQASLDADDGDQGAGGVLIVPNQTTGSYPHLLVQAGKSGEVYLLNRENLGGYITAGDQVVQELPYTVGESGTWTSPAYWNGTVYYWGQSDTLKAFPLVNGKLTGPTGTSKESYGYPGANPSISANGNTQGIVWTIDSEAYNSQGSSVLQAHDASNPGTTLYSSSTNASRDNPGPAVKYTVPTVANGKVYVGAESQLSVFGLLNGQQLAATPVLSPGAEAFSGSLPVTISDATTGATIYYTLDGSTPTVASAVYSTPITLTATTTIKAIASASGYLQSAVGSGTYTNSTQASTPTFLPAGGTYTTSQSVTINDATAGTTIYYTTNGTTPTTSSTRYAGAIAVNASETLKAIAVETGYTNSPVASAAYTLNIGQTGISFPVGFAGTAGIMIFNGSTDLDDTRLQLTNGGLAESGTAWYYQPVNVQSFTTNFSFQLSNPVADGITFAIQGGGIYSLGNSGSGLGYQGISNSIAIKFDLYNNAGEGADSTGLYINGAIPTVPAINLSTTGINLHSDDTMEVNLAYNGTVLSMMITDMVTGAAYSTNWTVNIPSIVGGNTAYVGFTGGTGGSSSSQKILTWVYTIGSSAPPVLMSPLFNAPGGAYSTSQSVSITSGSTGAAIYYTTDGTAPTTTSTKYTGAITVAKSETVSAMAAEAGYTNSAVAASAYTIGSTLLTPTFSPVAGTYTTSQSVTISDGTGGTAIYYTTNGTTPTTSSTKYTGSVSVSATETLKAIAVETGYTNSAMGTAAYTISGSSKTTPTVTVSSSLNPSNNGSSVTFTAVVSGSSGTPTGTVTFLDGSTTLGTGTLSSGSAKYVTAALTVGTHSIKASYGGDTNFNTASSTVLTQTVNTAGGTTYINYPSGGFTATNLSLNYGATVTGGLLQVTDGGAGEERTAWFVTPVPVGTFTSDFTFQLLNATADGMTFTIQGSGIYALGSGGGGLGYQGIPSSVAVKFDLYSNAGEGIDSTGLYTGGASPTVPSVDLSSTGINLHSGDIMHAHLIYDGTNLTMTLTDTVTNGTVTEVFPVNIPSMVGGTTAYVGFTGGTGRLAATQKVLSWTYTGP